MSSLVVREKCDIKETKFRKFLFSTDGKFIKEIRKIAKNGKKLRQDKIECLYNDLRVKLRLPKHTNIAQHLETYETPDKFIIVDMQYVTDLFEFKRSREFKEHEILHVANNVISGVSHMHKHKIIHCDLKIENLVVSSDGTIKLIDFEYAREFPPSGIFYTDTVGTEECHAPEMLARRWNVSVDIWCVGIVIDELNTGNYHTEYDKYTISSKIKTMTRQIKTKNPRNRLGYINDDTYDVSKIQSYINDHFIITPEISVNIIDGYRNVQQYKKSMEYNLPKNMPLIVNELKLTDSMIETTAAQ